MMNESFGWRGKIGLIINSGQVITEPLYNRLAPAGVGIYASRILVEGGVLESHLSMEREAFRAARELATADVDCLAYCCTVSGVLQGIEGDKNFCLRMAEETGIPTTSTLAAMLEALEILRLKKIVLISPYEEKTHDLEEEFLQANGFDVVKSRSMGISSRKKRTSTTPGEIFRFCRESWDKEADGLLISCMNFNAMPCIGPLEQDLGKPVLSSHSATLWKVLKMIGVRESVIGYGRLLADSM
jgi:maleate isomerase